MLNLLSELFVLFSQFQKLLLKIKMCFRLSAFISSLGALILLNNIVDVNRFALFFLRFVIANGLDLPVSVWSFSSFGFCRFKALCFNPLHTFDFANERLHEISTSQLTSLAIIRSPVLRKIV